MVSIIPTLVRIRVWHVDYIVHLLNEGALVSIVLPYQVRVERYTYAPVHVVLRGQVAIKRAIATVLLRLHLIVSNYGYSLNKTMFFGAGSIVIVRIRPREVLVDTYQRKVETGEIKGIDTLDMPVVVLLYKQEMVVRELDALAVIRVGARVRLLHRLLGMPLVGFVAFLDCAHTMIHSANPVVLIVMLLVPS